MNATHEQQEQGLVEVRCGVLSHTFPLAGESVGGVRKRLSLWLHIPADPISFVDGDLVEESVVLKEGQVLCFAPRTCNKC